QGIAIDDRGRLWIVDSGDHTVRRINLAQGLVETIAGKAGAPGFSDGNGEAARFSSPVGIAVVPVSAIEQLDRQRRGLPPAPTRVIVADTGNGVIRQVTETGEVSTINSAPADGSAPVRFNSPAGVALDESG